MQVPAPPPTFAPAPRPPMFPVGTIVEKHVGEARYTGVVLCVYRTTKGGERYVVEVSPQGFQMIATSAMLRTVEPPTADVYASKDSGGSTWLWRTVDKLRLLRRRY